MMTQGCACFLLWTCLCALTAGCAGGGSPVKVKGVLVADAKPLPKARLAFYPVEGGRPAVGLTDKEGRFQLDAYGNGTGLLPGEYKVVVTVEEDTKEKGVRVHPNYRNIRKTPLVKKIPPSRDLL